MVKQQGWTAYLGGLDGAEQGWNGTTMKPTRKVHNEERMPDA